MPKIPSIEKLFAHYPNGTPEEVVKLIGGQVEKNYMNPDYKGYKDTCTIRVCRALNYAGDPVPPVGHIDNPLRKGEKLRADKGGDGMRYIYSTNDMRAYLNMRYGFPKKFPPDASSGDVTSLKGIIAFAYLHMDLWNGTTCARGCYFGSPGITSDSILVWE